MMGFRTTFVSSARWMTTGLDDEAIRAAREWRFNPGHLGDTPVDVLVILLIDFHIR